MHLQIKRPSVQAAYGACSWELASFASPCTNFRVMGGVVVVTLIVRYAALVIYSMIAPQTNHGQSTHLRRYDVLVCSQACRLLSLDLLLQVLAHDGCF